jgi:hypothetical protein
MIPFAAKKKCESGVLSVGDQQDQDQPLDSTDQAAVVEFDGVNGQCTL